MPVSSHYAPDPRVTELGPDFYDAVPAAPFPRHVLRFRNQPAAERVGLGALTEGEWIEAMAHFRPLPGNLTTPLALRYHGHQFGCYNPDLGDGRGFLYAQLRDPVDGRLLDLGTKGSGTTPYSRGGDGRLTLKGGFREALATEMLEALGVETSRTLSVIETGEELWRPDEPSPTRSCVLVRLSHSHIRIGTFQRYAYLDQPDQLRRLLEYTVAHHFPEIQSEPDLPSAFLREVVRRCARMAASYTAAGFVHGVLNTDNVNVTGESFDYGPYRFLPRYDPSFTAAYFDHSGFYAFGRQPDAIHWSLDRLRRCLCPEASVEGFLPEYLRETARRIVLRLGLRPRGEGPDGALAAALFDFLEEAPVGYAQAFHDLFGGEARIERALSGPRGPHYRAPGLRAVRSAWEEHQPGRPELLEDPCLERDEPCTLLIDEIEALWERIDRHDDWSPFQAKLAEVRRMGEACLIPPDDGARVAPW